MLFNRLIPFVDSGRAAGAVFFKRRYCDGQYGWVFHNHKARIEKRLKEETIPPLAGVSVAG